MKPIWVYDSAPDYKGRRVHGPPGVQEAAVELLVRHAPARGAALDLASGSGTMQTSKTIVARSLRILHEQTILPDSLAGNP